MAESLADRVRTEAGTELDRLGSEKALIALTDATLETDAVLGTVIDSVAAARRVLEDWAEEADRPAVADALLEASAVLESLVTDLSAHVDRDPATDGPMAAYLAGCEDDFERAGAALLGVPLVLDRQFLQVVSFFVNEAATTLADAARDARSACEDVLALGEDLLADWNEADRDRAVAGAVAVVEAAYDDHVGTLEAMGFDPKPIC